MKKMVEIRLYWNTVKNLKWIQIRHQIQKRVLKKFRTGCLPKKSINLEKCANIGKIKIFIPELDCEQTYLHRFQIEKLLHNQVELLHETYRIGRDWNISEASHLWNYNLHYLEFLIPLAVKYREKLDEQYFIKWKEWMKSWLEQSSLDSLEAYTISMRIPNILICMELLKEKLIGTDLERKLMNSLYQQYQYLIRTQELALLANHYFENLKTIVISSLFFNELDVYHKYFSRFLGQIEEQILSGGLHFELSLMYHKIILEDILRVYQVQNSLGQRRDAEKLTSVIQKMASVMTEIEDGFGDRTPLFNDAGNNVGKGKDELSRAVEKICRSWSSEKLLGKESTGDGGRSGNGKISGSEHIRAFAVAGYFKRMDNNMAVLFGCGDLGPSYMGGHGHCDCLSFEISVKEKMLFVNSGTGQYQGAFRSFFRSTAAHNTLMIDDREQSELWGEHRAARRISNVKGRQIKNGFEGSFKSYYGDFFRRRLKWKGRNYLKITDDLVAHDKGIHTAREFLHLAPGYEYEKGEKQIRVKNGERLAAMIHFSEISYVLIHKDGLFTIYGEEFGRYDKKQVLEIRTPFQDKIRIHMEIEFLYGYSQEHGQIV